MRTILGAFSAALIAAALSPAAHASSFSGEVTIYNVFHFGHVYDETPDGSVDASDWVERVIAIPEVVIHSSDTNTDSVYPGAPVQLMPRGLAADAHFFGKSKSVAHFNYHADGSEHTPTKVRVRYLLYMQNGDVKLTGPFDVPAGPMYMLYGHSPQERDAIKTHLDDTFADVNDSVGTRTLFYSNEHYKDYLGGGVADFDPEPVTEAIEALNTADDAADCQ